MESRRLVALLFVAILIAMGLALWLVPRVSERLQPVPQSAFVGIEVDDSGVARVGRVSLLPGKPFRLHAILEAKTPSGETVYFTEAAGIDFGDGVVGDRVERWSGPQIVKVLWLTLEGAVPYLVLEDVEELAEFRFEEFFRAEWGRGWTASGSLEGRHNEQLMRDGTADGRPFGTQHYRAWIELFEDDRAIVPSERFKSPGFEELQEEPSKFSTAVVELAGSLATPSRVFGLSQIVLPEGADPSFVGQLARFLRDGLAFGRLVLLQAIVEGVGMSFEELDWQRLDLQQGGAFGERVQEGDLLRVGARWVVLFEDGGTSGVLDSEDLCMDFDRGAEVRPLSAVFVGGGDVEWASLGTRE